MGIFSPLITKTFVVSFNVGDLTEGSASYPTMSTASGSPVSGLAFSAAENQYMYNSFQVPSTYIEGEDAVVGVHYFNSATQSGTNACKWSVEYQSFDSGDNLDNKLVTTVSTNHYSTVDEITDTYHKATITISGTNIDNPLSKNKSISFRVYRDSECETDTLTDDAILTLLTFEFPVEDN